MFCKKFTPEYHINMSYIPMTSSHWCHVHF